MYRVLRQPSPAHPQRQDVSSWDGGGRAWQAKARFHVGGLQCRNPGNQEPGVLGNPHGREQKQDAEARSTSSSIPIAMAHTPATWQLPDGADQASEVLCILHLGPVARHSPRAATCKRRLVPTCLPNIFTGILGTDESAIVISVTNQEILGGKALQITDCSSHCGVWVVRNGTTVTAYSVPATFSSAAILDWEVIPVLANFF